jgi:hypothetical protein
LAMMISQHRSCGCALGGRQGKGAAPECRAFAE